MEGPGSADQPLLLSASGPNEDEESGTCQDGGLVVASIPSSSSSSSSSSSGNSVVLFSSLVAVCGSYAFGNAVGYSSPAETGIMDDLGLSLAEVSRTLSVRSFRKAEYDISRPT